MTSNNTLEASRETPKRRAERIRDQRHWTTFWFVVIAQALAFVANASGMFGHANPAYVFLGALIIGTLGAVVLHEWRTLSPWPFECLRPI